jgi:transcription-repair coupling factor (superfamily II helicase)
MTNLRTINNFGELLIDMQKSITELEVATEGFSAEKQSEELQPSCFQAATTAMIKELYDRVAKIEDNPAIENLKAGMNELKERMDALDETAGQVLEICHMETIVTQSNVKEVIHRQLTQLFYQLQKHWQSIPPFWIKIIEGDTKEEGENNG